jgi:hypothetical protein
MSILDKVMGAVAPPENDEQRAEATTKARAMAEPGDWLSMALDHHEAIRQAFEACRSTREPMARLAAMKALGMVLTGHSQAEEVVLYPALAKAGDKMGAGMAYTEQSTAKMQMAELERLDPGTQEWADKLEHIRGAVLHHMFEEEGGWFIRLRRDGDDQRRMTLRFREEFERYCGGRGMADGRMDHHADRASQDDTMRSIEEPPAFMGGP